MSKTHNISHKNSFWNMHLTTILSLSMVLFLVGLVSLFYFLANDMSNHMRENMTLSIILTDSIDNSGEKRIETLLIENAYAKHIKYISKEDALKEHIMEMGENPSDFLGYNPLLASFEVSLNAKYANNDSIHLIENFLKEFPEIESIVYQKDAIDLINTNIARIGVVLGVAALVLLFISIVLIHSTIRLMIYADRFLIKSMRLVGATSWFIRKPYIKRSMLDGFIASLLAIGYIAAFVYFLWHSFELNFFVEKPLIIGIVAGVVVLVGVILTAILAFFAVGKFLRMKSEKIYLI